MPLTDLRKNKTGYDLPAMVDVSEAPITAEVALEEIYEIEVVETPPTPALTEPFPDGRWGLEKVHGWFLENGIPYDEDTSKVDLVAAAKDLTTEQETS